MMAVGSFKKITGTAWPPVSSTTRSRQYHPKPAARIVRPVPNAEIWIGSEWLGTAGSPESSTHCQNVLEREVRLKSPTAAD